MDMGGKDSSRRKGMERQVMNKKTRGPIILSGAFQSYGKYYDIIYSDKDYEKECDFLEEILRRYSRSMPKTILDAGCGTGGHAIPLSKRDYEVTGMDLSEIMINIAKEKAKKNKVNTDFFVMDVRSFQLGHMFDACICMFSTMDYLTTNKDILKALSNIREHLKNGSLFIFDFWHGPAVLTILPSVREKTMEKEGISVVRLAKPHLDSLHHICKIDYHLTVTKENRVIDEVKERHIVRFFFPEEIEHYLEESGFKLLKLCPFLDLDNKPSERTWDVTAISKAI